MRMRNGRGGGVPADGGGGAKCIEEELLLPILLAEQVRKEAQEAGSFKLECTEVGRQVDLLADNLRYAARCAASTPSLYDRPIRRVFAEATKSLHRALAIVRRGRRAGVLRRVVTITTGSTDLRKALSLLDSSLGDLRWLLSVYSDSTAAGAGIGLGLGLPPIASTDPILSWVWTYIATIQMGAAAPADRTKATIALANLALDSDHNKKMIIEEGGIPPLLSLLRDDASLNSRIAAAAALSNLATGRENVTLILKELAIPIITGVLSDSPMKLQTQVAFLVSRMASHDPVAQEELVRENAICPLVSLLSLEVPIDDSMISSNPGSDSMGGSCRGRWHWKHSHLRKQKEKESPQVKLQLKVACAEALWMLSKRSVSSSRMITETGGLLCLAKIIEREEGTLQYNCLMTVMEIAAAAEFDDDLRRSAFKTNSAAVKLVVAQLLRLVQQGGSPALQIAAMKAVGSLARTFPARKIRILSPLVAQLGHWNLDVVAEAVNALAKFANSENFLCVEHSKAIIEFAGLPLLMRLLRSGEKTQMPALNLLCYLALHVPDSEALERSKVLGTLESVARTAVAQHSSIRELLPNAIRHLELYRVRPNSHWHFYAH